MAVNYGNHEHRFAATAWFGTEGMKVSWGGVFAGVLVAMGVSMLLAALGVAIGVSAVDPGETDPGTIGIGAAVWGGLQLLIALFIGGMVATRVGAIIDRTTGFFEGVLVWVVSLILMAYLAGSGIASVASGAFSMLGGATQTFSAVVQGQGGAGNIDVAGTVEQMAEQLRSPELVNRVASVTGLSVNETREHAERDRHARRSESQQSDAGRRGSEPRRRDPVRSRARERRAGRAGRGDSARSRIDGVADVRRAAAVAGGRRRGRDARPQQGRRRRRRRP